MKTIMIFFVCILTTLTLAQVDTGALKQKYDSLKIKIKIAQDSVLVPQATWHEDTLLVAGDRYCIHSWKTEFEGLKYTGAPDSLMSILNPYGERYVQEKCSICGREHIKSETIKFKKDKKNK